MNRTNTINKEITVEWALLVVGCVIYSLSTVLIKDVNVIPGSFLGLAVAANKIWNVPTGLMNLLLNIPVMILVTRKMGMKVLIYTCFIMAFTSLLIDWWSPLFPALVANPFLLAILGGVTMGIGAGLLILAKGTMAGTTALTLLIQRVLRTWSFGTILFCADSLIVLIGSLIVKDWKAILYSLLYSFCCAKTMDLIICFGDKHGLHTANGRVELQEKQ